MLALVIGPVCIEAGAVGVIMVLMSSPGSYKSDPFMPLTVAGLVDRPLASIQDDWISVTALFPTPYTSITYPA